MTVTLLSLARAQRKAPPSLLVERINDTCRWQVEPGEHCSEVSYGLRCFREAKFVVSKLGSKKAWLRCAWCLDELLENVLERPQAEIDEIERKATERSKYAAAKLEAQSAHDAAGLCDGYSAKAPFGLCRQKAVVRVDKMHGDETAYCERHARRYRRWKWKLIPILVAVTPHEENK